MLTVPVPLCASRYVKYPFVHTSVASRPHDTVSIIPPAVAALFCQPYTQLQNTPSKFLSIRSNANQSNPYAKHERPYKHRRRTFMKNHRKNSRSHHKRLSCNAAETSASSSAYPFAPICTKDIVRIVQAKPRLWFNLLSFPMLFLVFCRIYSKVFFEHACEIMRVGISCLSRYLFDAHLRTLQQFPCAFHPHTR